MARGMRVLLLLLWLGLVYGAEEDWNKKAQDELKATLARKLNTNVAKNVILFLGDGMSIATVTAVRIYAGQQAGKTGEETVLHHETWPSSGFSKTYGTDFQTTDSAGSSVAYLCGEKSRYGVLGVNQHVQYDQCDHVTGNEIDSILKWMQKEGKSTGVVTNTRITHATPGGAYAHSANRNWEGDSKLKPEDVGKCEDIASQLVTRNTDINVLLGGGRQYFLPENETDPEEGKPGKRKDGRNLIQEWRLDKAARGLAHAYVWNHSQFNDVDAASTDFLFGLFDYSHMEYEAQRGEDQGKEPSLTEMAVKAIQILEKNDKGYFLLLESGRMDHAHHDGKAHLALVDGLEFNRCMSTVMSRVSTEDTLAVLTADHSFAFSIGGYATRGADILGFVDTSKEEPRDGLPRLILSYADGPGARDTYDVTGRRRNLTGSNLRDYSFKQDAIYDLEYATHDAQDVGIWAIGPMAHLFEGVHEQNYIAHAMAYAACVGENKDHCKATPGDTLPTCGSIMWRLHTSLLLLSWTVPLL